MVGTLAIVDATALGTSRLGVVALALAADASNALSMARALHAVCDGALLRFTFRTNVAIGAIATFFRRIARTVTRALVRRVNERAEVVRRTVVRFPGRALVAVFALAVAGILTDTMTRAQVRAHHFLASRTREARLAEALAAKAGALAIALQSGLIALLTCRLVAGRAREALLANAGEVLFGIALAVT